MKTSHKKRSALARHAEMVSDPFRTPLLFGAIKKIIKPGDVVLDLGCGLGVLSLMAIRAGARRVYACDVDAPSLSEARKRAQKEGVADRIFFYNNLSSEIFLTEKIDVMMAETVGSLGLDENIAPFVIDARDRFLKKGGKIIPKKLSVFGAPVEADRGGKTRGGYTTTLVSPPNLLALPKKYFEVDFLKIKKTVFDQSVVFRANRDGILTGLAVWFEAEWATGVITKTSPFNPPTHWKQGFLKNRRIRSLKAGDNLVCRLKIGPNEQNPTRSVIEWGFQ